MYIVQYAIFVCHLAKAKSYYEDLGIKVFLQWVQKSVSSIKYSSSSNDSSSLAVGIAKAAEIL